MPYTQGMRLRLGLFLLTLPVISGCTALMTRAQKPCTGTAAGQPAHDDGKVGKGNKQCEQIRDSAGGYVNHGHYIEWYVSGKRMLEGDYASGSKSGKWSEWDEQGKLIAEKWYENGSEVPGRENQPYNGLKSQPKIAPAATQSTNAPVPFSERERGLAPQTTSKSPGAEASAPPPSSPPGKPAGESQAPAHLPGNQ
jgi:hypothetical protein